MKQKEITKL